MDQLDNFKLSTLITASLHYKRGVLYPFLTRGRYDPRILRKVGKYIYGTLANLVWALRNNNFSLAQRLCRASRKQDELVNKSYYPHIFIDLALKTGQIDMMTLIVRCNFYIYTFPREIWETIQEIMNKGNIELLQALIQAVSKPNVGIQKFYLSGCLISDCYPTSIAMVDVITQYCTGSYLHWLGKIARNGLGRELLDYIYVKMREADVKIDYAFFLNEKYNEGILYLLSRKHPYTLPEGKRIASLHLKPLDIPNRLYLKDIRKLLYLFITGKGSEIKIDDDFKQNIVNNVYQGCYDIDVYLTEGKIGKETAGNTLRHVKAETKADDVELKQPTQRLIAVYFRQHKVYICQEEDKAELERISKKNLKLYSRDKVKIPLIASRYGPNGASIIHQSLQAYRE